MNENNTFFLWPWYSLLCRVFHGTESSILSSAQSSDLSLSSRLFHPSPYWASPWAQNRGLMAQ